MWVARNLDGTLELFKNKPSRCTLETTNLTKESKRYGKVTTHEFWDEDQVFDGYDKWYYPGDYFEIDSSLFPELTWKDEPVEVEPVSVNRRVCDYCGYSYTYHDSDIIDESEPEKENFWMYTVCPKCGRNNCL